MARILYAVHGTGHGHAIRALTVARRLREHDLLFISHGAGLELLRPEFPVEDCPSLVTVIKAHKVAGAATVRANLRILLQSRAVLERLHDIIKHFRPEVALTDYEFFLPRVCRRLGLPCLSLDHQHVLTCCRHPVPLSRRPASLVTRQVVARLFSRADAFLVTSFFRPPLKPGLDNVRLLPPLLRETVLQRRPEPGGHVVAYQGYATFRRFFPFLRAIPREVRVYGFEREGREGNLIFKRPSEAGFLDDLASCAYVVCGGSHSLLSEALYYGKPVLSFPIRNAFEQYLNAFYLERLGFGLACTGFRPKPTLISTFEERLPHFRAAIAAGHFLGNPEILSHLHHFIRHHTLPPV
ncbi:MAG: hypothetical protein FJ128_01650 [Deltaproteobacteria bacterium]|nr:hypothetical protein [Deltaproteobacteria bacterium]